MNKLNPINMDVILGIHLGVTAVEKLWWDEVTQLENMSDQHLKNAALKLVGMGSEPYIDEQLTKEMWLKVLQLEWERRLAARRVNKEKGILKSLEKGE